MVLVSGGRYEMKTRKGEIEVTPFCLDVLETTAHEYAVCITAGKCTQAHLDACDGATIHLEGKGDHPIVCVDFAQANAYCAFRNKRLLVDEEWEWAARGGSEGWEFPWGDESPSDQLCWSGNGQRSETCRVGSFPKGDSPLGVKDLAGNVFEWTTTRHDARIPERSGRGGSWRDGVRAMVRSTRPGWFKPDYRCGFLGIRCATDAP
jgi:formylglycine-generating enzyme required for sulfatase activity